MNREGDGTLHVVAPPAEKRRDLDQADLKHHRDRGPIRICWLEQLAPG